MAWQQPSGCPAADCAAGETRALVETGNHTRSASNTDPENSALRSVLVVGPSNGSLVLNADWTFTSTQSAEFCGLDAFVYRASDGQKVSADTLLTIDVTPVDDGPAPLTVTGFPASGQTLTAVLSDDPDGPGLDPVAFHWLRDEAAIDATLVLTASDVGHAISVTATYTDGQGLYDVTTSAAADTVGVTITGTNAANTHTGASLAHWLSGLCGNDVLHGNAAPTSSRRRRQ